MASSLSSAAVQTRASARSPAPSRLRVVAAAGKGKEQAPRKGAPEAVLKALGLLAAANLAFTGTPALAADPLPASAESSAARAERNRETSNLPSFKDVGNALKKEGLPTNDPKEVGRALDRNTPDVNPTKNPQDQLKDAGKAAQRAIGNVSEAPASKNPFDKSGAGIPINDDLKDLKSRASKTAGAGAKKVEEAADAAKKGGKKVNEAAGNLSLDLNPANLLKDEAEKLESGKSKESPIRNVEEKASKLDSKLDPTKGTGGVPAGSAAQKAGAQAEKASQSVRSASENIKSATTQNVTGNVSLSNPFASEPEKAVQEGKSAVKDAGREASKAGAKLPNPSEVGDKAKGAGKEAARKAQQVTGSVSTASVTTDSDKKSGPLTIKDVEASQPRFPSPTELSKLDRGEAQSAAERFAGETGGNLPKAANAPNPGDLTKKLPSVGLPDFDPAKAASKAAGKAQEAAGNLSLSNPFASGPEKAVQEGQSAVKDAGREASKVANKLPGPSEVGDKAKGAGKEAGRKVQQVTGSVSVNTVGQVDPNKVLNKGIGAAKGAANEASGAAKGAAKEAQGAAKGAAKDAQGAAKDASKKVQGR